MAITAPVAIDPVRRCFAVLEALNRRRSSTLAILAAETALPKPTLARHLETLIALGYVARISRQLGYRITDRVLGLSAGIRFVDHLVDVAAPHMRRFTQAHGWPLYLGTITDGAIAIRYSTAPESPMSFESSGYRRRHPPLYGAIGRAYLAFCPADERRALLREIAALRADRAVSPRRPEMLERDFERIRRDGYAFQSTPRPSRFTGIAVPVRRAERVFAAVSLRYPRSTMSDVEAGSAFGPLLTALASAIATDLAAKHA